MTTDRGFTGHEMLDDVSLVHMNGRVYDPDLGRFLSPDPVISDQANPQTINPYSYVSNNPLSFTDPNGFVAYPIGDMMIRAIKSLTASGDTSGAGNGLTNNGPSSVSSEFGVSRVRGQSKNSRSKC